MKWYYYLFIILGLVLLAYLAYSFYSIFKKGLNPKQANEMLKDGKFRYIVDVRTDEEFNKGHYTPSNKNVDLIHIGMEKLVSQLPIKIPNKKENILFQCKKGIRSKAANSIAESLGYKNTKYLIGDYTDLE